MSYANAPYGSLPLGGSPAAGDVAPSPATQALILTLQVPVWVVKHSNPATFALGLTIHAPLINKLRTVFPSTQALSLSLHAPSVHITAQPGVLALTLTQWGPVHNQTVTADHQSLTLGLGGASYDITIVAATLDLTLTGLDVHIPTGTVVFVPKGTSAPFRLGLSSPKVPHRDALRPRIVRYIKDPIVQGGCPQCGTYLFYEGIGASSDEVRLGRNFDTGDYNDSKYVRCARCGFWCNPERDAKSTRGARTGWGINYTEVEAGSE